MPEGPSARHRAIAATRDGVAIAVRLRPRAPRERVGPLTAEHLEVAVRELPVEGRANDALREALARALGVPPSAVEVARGLRGRHKLVRVRGVDEAAARRALA